MLADRIEARFASTGRKMLEWPTGLADDDDWRGAGWVAPTSAMASGRRWNGEAGDLDYDTAVTRAYKGNGIVFACAQARALPFSEARFAWQEMKAGRPGRLHANPAGALELLEHPFGPTSTTGNMLARMEQDATNAGNCYMTVVGGGTRLRRLRPDCVAILSGIRRDVEADELDAMDAAQWDLEAEVLAYFYRNPKRPGEAPTMITPERMVHYAPTPDPDAQWRGMSWLTPVLTEIGADAAMTSHKNRFMRNGAMLNVVVKYDKGIRTGDYERFVELFERQHSGSANAYKTLHLGGGADATVVGTDLKSIDYKAVQGAGETRIAAAAGVGAIMARLSEGMQGSSLNSGNYGSAKRQFADMTLRPLWREAATSLANVARAPSGSRLWFDARDVAFLHDDAKDEAEILKANAEAVNSLVTSGYEPDAVIDAVISGDISRLEGKHTGLFSIQLQRPGGMKRQTLEVTDEERARLMKALEDRDQ